MTIVVGSIAATGIQGITLPSRPRFILFTGTNRTENDVIVTSGQCGGFLGMACNDAFGSETIKNYCEFAMITSQQCSNLSERCCYAQSAIGSFGTNTLYEATVTAFEDLLLNPGFTINFTTGSASHVVSYMAFCGIDGSMSFPYETACDGDPFLIDTTVLPSLVVALGQWRASCHTFPKSTSNQPWCSAGIADLAGGPGVLNSSWMFNTWMGGPNKLTQRWNNNANQPGVNAKLGVISAPFVFGTTIDLGYLEATDLGTTLNLNQDPGSGGQVDYAIAVLNETCTRMECGKVSAGAEGGTETFDLDAFSPVEAALLMNVETTATSANASGKWGFGFATPLSQLSWIADAAQGCFYQTFQHGWIPSVTPTAVSFGDVDFTPPADDIGFTTIENGAGGGLTLWGALATFCDAPPIVSFSGFNTHRPSGTQITTRGGHITPGEGT